MIINISENAAALNVIHYCINGTLFRFDRSFVCYSFTESVGLLRREMIPLQYLYLESEQHKEYELTQASLP
jgi:hypothetical protein